MSSNEDNLPELGDETMKDLPGQRLFSFVERKKGIAMSKETTKLMRVILMRKLEARPIVEYPSSMTEEEVLQIIYRLTDYYPHADALDDDEATEALEEGGPDLRIVGDKLDILNPNWDY